MSVASGGPKKAPRRSQVHQWNADQKLILEGPQKYSRKELRFITCAAFSRRVPSNRLSSTDCDANLFLIGIEVAVCLFRDQLRFGYFMVLLHQVIPGTSAGSTLLFTAPGETGPSAPMRRAL